MKPYKEITYRVKFLPIAGKFQHANVFILARPDIIWLRVLGLESPCLCFQELIKDLELQQIELGNPV